MIDLNLSPTRLKAFEAALTESHDIRITVTILDKDEKALGALQPDVLSGAVQMDASQAVTHSLSLVCLDPHHGLTFDGNSPSAGALFADNFVAVEYGVHVDDGDFWVDVPVFHGPLTGFERQGPQVTIEAQGKESLALDPHLVIHGYTLHHHMTIVKAIKNVLDRIGERSYNINGLGGKLHRHRAIAPGAAPWLVLVGGATDAKGHAQPGLMSKASGHKYLFYNGRGQLSFKNRVTASRWTFDGSCVLSEPTITYDVSSARNHVEVQGHKPLHAKKHFRGHASLPASHPLSPHALARHGKDRYLVTFYESDSLKSNHACTLKAKSLLDGAEGVSAQFDSLVIPHLEANDTAKFALDNVSFTWPIRQFTIPLTADASMSVGYNKAVKPHRHKHRTHHHHHHHGGH